MFAVSTRQKYEPPVLSRMTSWAPERIAKLSMIELRQLKDNALRLGEPELAAQCEEAMTRLNRLEQQNDAGFADVTRQMFARLNPHAVERLAIFDGNQPLGVDGEQGDWRTVNDRAQVGIAAALGFLRLDPGNSACDLGGDHLDAGPGSGKDFVVGIRTQIQEAQHGFFVPDRDHGQSAQAFAAPEDFEAARDLIMANIGGPGRFREASLSGIRFVM